MTGTSCHLKSQIKRLFHFYRIKFLSKAMTRTLFHFRLTSAVDKWTFVKERTASNFGPNKSLQIGDKSFIMDITGLYY